MTNDSITVAHKDQQGPELRSVHILTGKSINESSIYVDARELASLVVRSAVAAGHLWALFTFLFVTVWSPTLIALALFFIFNGAPGVRELIGFLLRRLAANKLWYVIGVLVPIASVSVAILVARNLHSAAPFIPLAALPFTVALQLFTGANSQRQLPTDHDYAVPTREYQTDPSSLKTGCCSLCPRETTTTTSKTTPPISRS